MWTVEFLNIRVVAEMEAQPDDIRAKFLRIVNMIEVKGLHQVREPT
jgi:hypothetical protein